MEELKNKDKNGISTERKIGKTTYEVVLSISMKMRQKQCKIS